MDPFLKDMLSATDGSIQLRLPEKWKPISKHTWAGSNLDGTLNKSKWKPSTKHPCVLYICNFIFPILKNVQGSSEL